MFNYLQLSLFVRVAKPKTKLFTRMTKAIVVELEFADDYGFHKGYHHSSFSLKSIVFGLVLSWDSHFQEISQSSISQP